MKEIASLAIGLVVIGVLVYVLAHAAVFFSSVGLNYTDTFTSVSTSTPGTGSNKVTPVFTDEEAWAPLDPNVTGVSPYQSKVLFDSFDIDVDAEKSEYEYVSIRASVQNLDAVNVSKWTIQSLVSGTTVPFPRASLFFKQGEANHAVPIYLAPGEYAYLVTGSSPAGISFHTNPCIGMLANDAYFQPRLPATCPSAARIMPATLHNIRTYGEKCISYVASINSCEIPRTNIPKDLLPACVAEIQKELTYNKCFDIEFNANKYHTFDHGGWYLYLNKPTELWRDQYDVLRLLDENGRVVDVFSY
jgi:hypothetical protein